MFPMKYVYYFMILHSIIAIPQFNLHYTDWVNQTQNDNNNNTLQHTCLRITPYDYEGVSVREIISYCMSEWPFKFNVQNDNHFSQLTFSDLATRNITSQQLYLWSTPIDTIEHYQLYLNQLSTTNNSALSSKIYYNCTLPRFGPMCQYELLAYHPHYSSLNEIINDFYWNSRNNQTNLTCYTHLQCNRSVHSSCLDWSEICNGQIDCLNGGVDEEHCWQLEINQCKDDEYRCRNGQCIPQLFYDDHSNPPDCIDFSDSKAAIGRKPTLCYSHSQPSIACEDIPCVHSPFTSSCDEKRENLLIDMMYSSNDHTDPEDCWSAFKCLIEFLPSDSLTCNESCGQTDCKKIFINNCPNDLFFPNVPVLFNNIYFVYRKSDFNLSTDFSTVPFYICYNTSQYDHHFINISKIFFSNMTCVNSKLYSGWDFTSYPVGELLTIIIRELYRSLKQYHLSFNYTSAICNTSKMYQCIHSSKCISVHRLMDLNGDCPYEDDENFSLINTTNVREQLNKTHYKCQATDKYIHKSLIVNFVCDCEGDDPDWCEDEDLATTYLKTNIVFQHICDGFPDLSPKMITGRNETDETECEQWQCNNIYTRCNGVWNCPNGVDESGCKSHPILNCTKKEHLCVSPTTNQFMCLSVEKANDGIVDCLGATDESTLCNPNLQYNVGPTLPGFYCMNQHSESCIFNGRLCDGKKQCENGNDEQFCTTNRTDVELYGICISFKPYENSELERFLCSNRDNIRRWYIIRFRIIPKSEEIGYQEKNIANTLLPSSSIVKPSEQHPLRCHRGLNLRVWVNNKTGLINDTCLCPPNYYGDRCQYQIQRISLAIRFRVLSSSRQTLFAIIILLIDDSDQRIIHSYEQFTYLSIRDCGQKFNIYLLYSTQPKDSTKNYSIHVDIYEIEKVPLVYRGSILLPVKFSFLPVHRLAFIVDIPRSNDKSQSCLNKKCVHGKCIKYYNNLQNLTFCQCDEGWSGKHCNIQHNCTCASDSLCIGILANNQSICVCPMNRFGPRCFLNNTIYQTDNNFTCQNGSQVILGDHYLVPYQKSVCICPKGYNGYRCEIADNQLILSFADEIILSQSILIHFIEVLLVPGDDETVVRGSTFQSIPLRQDSIKIYWSRPFHLVFTELFDEVYYLTVFQKNYNQSSIITKMIDSSDHCPHVRELFNQTIVQLDLIRRIKYYHLPCQNQSLNLSCFYDEGHLCVCYDFEDQRLANCFKFDHNMTYDCLGANECENGGQCLQDKPDCPTTSVCMCLECFYGRRCQFSTRGFGLSLDAILGYHIIPSVSFIRQTSIIKISLALTIIFIAIGLINGILSLLTFKNKVIREVGCGIYLLGTSITSLFTMFVFGLKFLILLFAQMSTISNRTFLQVQCHSLDFILQICLYMDQWLNACVALERAMTTIKGTTFDKKKSKKAAKYVICGLLIMIFGTCIHDAIYRRLIDEENETDNTKRIWCIVEYPSSSLEVYNYIIHCFHFFGPFLINLLSSIILVTKKSRQQATVHTQRSYRDILKEQIQQHKHVLIAPIVLVILALPRLIITFLSKCMKSANDVWLSLIGYFLSFIPSMLTFVVFIVPSKFYTKEFRTTLRQVRTTIQRRLHLTIQR